MNLSPLQILASRMKSKPRKFEDGGYVDSNMTESDWNDLIYGNGDTGDGGYISSDSDWLPQVTPSVEDLIDSSVQLVPQTGEVINPLAQFLLASFGGETATTGGSSTPLETPETPEGSISQASPSGALSKVSEAASTTAPTTTSDSLAKMEEALFKEYSAKQNSEASYPSTASKGLFSSYYDENGNLDWAKLLQLGLALGGLGMAYKGATTANDSYEDAAKQNQATAETALANYTTQLAEPKKYSINYSNLKPATTSFKGLS